MREIEAKIDVDGVWFTVNGERVMLRMQAKAFGDPKRALEEILRRYFNQSITITLPLASGADCD